MYSLNIWTKPDSDETRIYINGTYRKGVYFKMSKFGKLVWSSKANDTPSKYRTGNHYGKVNKDRAAAREVAEAYGVTLGDESTVEDWERLLQIAQDGVQIAAE